MYIYQFQTKEIEKGFVIKLLILSYSSFMLNLLNRITNCTGWSETPEFKSISSIPCACLLLLKYMIWILRPPLLKIAVTKQDNCLHKN